MAATTTNRSRSLLPGRAAVDALSTCACGQALDTWYAAYCPRCGVRVEAGPAGSVPRLSPHRTAGSR